MQELSTEQNRLPANGKQFPQSVAAAGVIWIVFGCLAVLLSVLIIVVFFLRALLGPNTEAPAEYTIAVVAALVGIAFIRAGLQSVRGRAKDTLIGAVCSILIGLWIGAGGVAFFLQILVTPREEAFLALAFGIMFGLTGIGLMAAGILGLVGRPKYKAWRQVHRFGNLLGPDSSRPQDRTPKGQPGPRDGGTDIQTGPR